MAERRLLKLLGHTGRDPMTCLYRCGNACDHPVPNNSDNETFADVVASRRGLFRAGGRGAGVGSGGGWAGGAPPPPGAAGGAAAAGPLAFLGLTGVP
ncbi:phosphatase, partial [Actinoplanes sp. NPDC051633]